MFVHTKSNLSAIFNSDPVFLFDRRELFDIATQSDVPAVLIDDLIKYDEELSQDVVFVISDRELRSTLHLSRLLTSRNVLQIPTHAFDGSVKASLYTLEMCKTLNLSDCAARNRAVLGQISSDRSQFSLESERSSVTFSLFDDIRIMQTATEDKLANGDDYALSTYTEVALLPHRIDPIYSEPQQLGYDVSGEFECDGCLIAAHFGAPESTMFRKRRLIEIVDDLHRNDEFPLRVELKNSKFKTIATRSGQIVTEEFVRQMDDVLSNNVMELALGTNAGANADTLLWRYNSPINESALGFHVAVGDGERSPHVDFMCASEASYDAFFQDGRH